MGQILTILNFFENIFADLDPFQDKVLLIGGDFNLCLTEKDKEGGRPFNQSHPISRTLLLEAMNDLDLVDAWRIFNPTLHQFTWRQANIKCRLDFFLTSTALLNNIKKVEHSYGFRTDHSYITLEMNTNMIKRGPGFFKLNTSLLIDTKYTTIIKKLILDKKAEYAQQNLAPDLKWETVKSDIRGESIKYSKIKAKKLKAKTQEIENKLHELE